jgi:hypothetical protein
MLILFRFKTAIGAQREICLMQVIKIEKLLIFGSIINMYPR